MEKRLKKVQRGAAVGFVVLKILRILLIIAAVALIAGLVFLAVVNENDLPLDAVKNGKLVLDMRDLDLSQLNIDALPDVGGLVQDGVLTLDLRDAKLVLLMCLGVGVLALAALYVMLLVAGNIFKHMKAEDTPFTSGNVRRLRLLGALYLAFWACGIALSYFVSSEIIRRLALPADKVTLSLNIPSVLWALLLFLLARIFSFGKAQGEALQSLLPAPAPAPVPVEPEPVPEPVVEPEPIPEPVYEPIPEPAPEPEPIPEAPAPSEIPDAPEEPPEFPEE